MTVDEAIDIMARHVVATSAAEAEWADFPEIGEHDWAAVVRRVDELTSWPDRYEDAYALLESRAEHDV